MKPRRRQSGDSPTKSVARQGMKVVEVDDAIAGEHDPGRPSHHESLNTVSHRIPDENQHGPIAPRGSASHSDRSTPSCCAQCSAAATSASSAQKLRIDIRGRHTARRPRRIPTRLESVRTVTGGVDEELGSRVCAPMSPTRSAAGNSERITLCPECLSFDRLPVGSGPGNRASCLSVAVGVGRVHTTTSGRARR
jgi:hypothetical protein